MTNYLTRLVDRALSRPRAAVGPLPLVRPDITPHLVPSPDMQPEVAHSDEEEPVREAPRPSFDKPPGPALDPLAEVASPAALTIPATGVTPATQAGRAAYAASPDAQTTRPAVSLRMSHEVHEVHEVHEDATATAATGSPGLRPQAKARERDTTATVETGSPAPHPQASARQQDAAATEETRLALTRPQTAARQGPAETRPQLRSPSRRDGGTEGPLSNLGNHRRAASAESDAGDPRGSTDPGAAPVIRVSVGRVDVRAVLPPAPVRAAPARPGPRLSLSDYLKQHNRGQR